MPRNPYSHPDSGMRQLMAKGVGTSVKKGPKIGRLRGVRQAAIGKGRCATPQTRLKQ